MANNLAKYIVELEAQVAKYERNLARANKKLDRFTNRQEKQLDRIKAGFIKLGVTVGASLGIGRIGKEFVRVGRQTGILRAQLETATGSIEGAQLAFSKLEKFAAQTPFALDQSVTAFTRLVNLGLTPSERALRSYGNTAAATGKDLLQFVEAVADATVGEFERLKEFGIKASKEGDKVSFRFRGLTTTVGNSIQEIEEFLTQLGENEFAGGLDRRIETLDGKLSNLGDSWDTLFRTIGELGVDDIIKTQVENATKALDTLNTALSDSTRAELSRKLTRALVAQADLEEKIKEIRATGGGDDAIAVLSRSATKLQGQMVKIRQQLFELDRAAPGGSLKDFSEQGEAGPGEFVGPPEETANAAAKRQLELRDATKEYGQELLKLANNAPSLAGKIASIYEGAATNIEKLTERQKVAGEKFDDLFTQNLVQAANNGFDSVLESWAKTVQQMAAKLLSSQLFKLLANIGGGGAGSFGGFITDLFGGSFATGGTVPGPLGAPRLILAHAGEEVIPIGGGGGGANVRIDNIDARGATADVVPLIEEGVARAVKIAAADRVQAKRRGK